MTQNYFLHVGPEWWCGLCPANYQTCPGITAQTHFEQNHSMEELYDPNRPSFRGTWPQTKEELFELLEHDMRHMALECGCNEIVLKEICGTVDNPCGCYCHRIFDTIKKIKKL